MRLVDVVLDDGDEMISLAGLEVSVLSVQLNSKGIFCAENPRMRRSLHQAHRSQDRQFSREVKGLPAEVAVMLLI